MSDVFAAIPIKGQIWRHTKSGKEYEITGATFNAITDHADVLYKPLYPSDIPLFSRQMYKHPKSFMSKNDDGTPRYTRVR